MRTLRLYVCLLISVALLIFAGCSKKGPGTKGPSGGGTGGAAFRQVTIYLANCTASDEPVVAPGDKVDWQSNDGKNYTIRFSDATEPTTNPLPVHPGVSNPRPIKGHDHCPFVSSKAAYYCKYSLTRESTLCTDPGIYIK